MKSNRSFFYQFIILILIVYIFGFLLPETLLDSDTGHISPFIVVLILCLERLYFYLTMKKSIHSINMSLDVLRNLLSRPLAEALIFEFSIFSIKPAMRTAIRIKNAVSEVLYKQTKLTEEYKTLNNDLAHNISTQKILLEITQKMISTEDPTELYDLFLQKSIQLIQGAEKGSLLLIDDNDFLRFVAAYGFDFSKLKTIRLRAHESSLSDGTTFHLKPYIINEIHERNFYKMDTATCQKLFNVTQNQIRATLMTPILVDEKIYGMINLDSTVKGAFKQMDITTMLFFSSQLSIAIKNRQLLDQTLYLSRYDHLTGIYNRRFFEDNFYTFHEQVLKGNSSFLILLMDLNHLKKINDTFGHIAGDKALRTFVTQIEKDLPENTLLARYGGDEFIAILPDMNYKEGHELMETSVMRFQSVSMPFNNQNIPIRYSFGLAASPDESMILDILVKIADQRMYTHKENMKAQTPDFFDSLTL